MKINTKSSALIASLTLASIMGFFVFVVGTATASNDNVIYDPETNTWIVSPTGEDDTNNIQYAFDQAVITGSGSTVQLTDGDFYLSKGIVVANFDGYFKGAGKEITTLKTRDDYLFPLTPPGTESHPDGLPRLFVFYLDETWPYGKPITLGFSDLSISIEGKTVVYSSNFNCLFAIIHIQGRIDPPAFQLDPINIIIEHVEFRGDRSLEYIDPLLTGCNVYSAIFAISNSVNEYFSGSFIVSDNTFQTNLNGIFASFWHESTIEITQNQFNDISGSGIRSGYNILSSVSIKDNYISTSRNGMVFLGQGGTYDVINNVVQGLEAISPIEGTIDDVLIRNNYITGQYVYGINPWFHANRWVITDNKFENIYSNFGAVTIQGSNDCIVSGNVFKNVDGFWGAVALCLDSSRNSIGKILRTDFAYNDYTQSGLPGWTTGGPGCIFLDVYTSQNIVNEQLFPKGTTAYDQIWILGDGNKITLSTFLVYKLITYVEALVDSGVLKHGVGRALTNKLENVIDLIYKRNLHGASQKLNDFIDQVEALIQSRELSAEQGQELIALAQEAIVLISSAELL